MLLSADVGDTSWSGVIRAVVFGFGILLLTAVFITLVRAYTDMRRARIVAGHEERLRELVKQFEQLTAASLEAQQRTATELAEVRTIVASIEQMIRTVD